MNIAIMMLAISIVLILMRLELKERDYQIELLEKIKVLEIECQNLREWRNEAEIVLVIKGKANGILEQQLSELRTVNEHLSAIIRKDWLSVVLDSDGPNKED